MTVFYKLTHNLKVWLQRQLEFSCPFLYAVISHIMQLLENSIVHTWKIESKRGKQSQYSYENNTDPLKASQGPQLRNPCTCVTHVFLHRVRTREHLHLYVQAPCTVTGTRLTLNDYLMNQWNGNDLLALQGGGRGGEGVGKRGGEGERRGPGDRYRQSGWPCITSDIQLSQNKGQHVLV